MRTKLPALRAIIGALLVAGAMGAACSSHQRRSDTTVAQAPLGQSTADYPANPSATPPDAAMAPEQNVGPVHTLSPGAVRGSTQGAPVTTPPAQPGQPAPTQPAQPTTTPPETTPPNIPPPTPSSPNSPSSPPAPNPIPPTGGGPTSSMSVEPSTVPSARGTFLEPLDPYQARSDGGITPPTAPRDGGIGGGGRTDGGIGGGRADGGIGGGGRSDGGIGGTGLRRDGGLR